MRWLVSAALVAGAVGFSCSASESPGAASRAGSSGASGSGAADGGKGGSGNSGQGASSGDAAGGSAADAGAADGAGRIVALAAGERHSCALEASGRATCWGNRYEMNLHAPSHAFTMIDAGGNYGCGVRGDRKLACWGGDETFGEELLPPDGEFVDVSVSGYAACGVRVDGSLTCWGGYAPDASLLPAGSFTAVSAWRSRGCALSSAGAVVCWSGLEAPAGVFSKIAVSGSGAVCGVRDDQRLVCTGVSGFSESQSAYADVEAGESAICGLRTDGTLACFQVVASVQAFSEATPTGQFAAVGVGSDHACALRTSGELVCWGNATTITTDLARVVPQHLGEAPLAAPRALTLTGGRSGFCALKPDGWLGCWRRHMDDPARMAWFPVAAGSFRDFAVGWPTCGLRQDGTVSCFDPRGPVTDTVPNEPFVRLFGGDFACGQRADGTLSCWSSNSSIVLATPPDAFKYVSVGMNVGCGIKTDDTLVCWGTSAGPDVPPGKFQHIGAGTYVHCGQRVDGSWVCFGSTTGGCDSLSDAGAGGNFCTTAPTGPFVRFAYSDGTGCAIDSNGKLVCWPASSWPVPEGTFSDVDVRANDACAMSTDERVRCFRRTSVSYSALEPPYGF